MESTMYRLHTVDETFSECGWKKWYCALSGLICYYGPTFPGLPPGLVCGRAYSAPSAGDRMIRLRIDVKIRIDIAESSDWGIHLGSLR